MAHKTLPRPKIPGNPRPEFALNPKSSSREDLIGKDARVVPAKLSARMRAAKLSMRNAKEE